MWLSTIILLFMGFSIHAEETATLSAVTVKKSAVKAATVQANEALKPAVKAATVHNEALKPAVKAATVHNEALKPAVKAATVQANEALKPAVKAATVHNEALKPAVKAATVHNEALKPAVKAAAVHNEAVKLEVAEKQVKCEKSSYCRFSQNKANKGFFSAYFTNSFNIFQDFVFNGRSLRIGYGGDFFFPDSSFELNINIHHSTPSFGLKYEHSFLKHYKWFPGFDASFLFGLIDEKNRSYRELLAVGLEGGPFLTTFISNHYALIARTGLSYSVPVSGNIFEEDIYFYISFGFKRYFR